VRSEVNFYRLVGSILAEALSPKKLKARNRAEADRFNLRTGGKPGKRARYTRTQTDALGTHNQAERIRYDANEKAEKREDRAATYRAAVTRQNILDPVDFRPSAERPGVQRARDSALKAAEMDDKSAASLRNTERQAINIRNRSANNARPSRTRLRVVRSDDER
jgi:hypothetical protein